jgi:nucleotide-binding universal stress UspA family protein
MFFHVNRDEKKGLEVMAAKKILCATDYSKASKAALVLATSLARQSGATLLIAHVSERGQYPVGELFDDTPQPDEEEYKELKAVVPTDPQVKFEHRLLYGPPGSAEIAKPADEILKLAEKENVEMIVIGMQGRSALAELLMGSVAESLLHRACCPVVTVKQPNRTWHAQGVGG